MVRLFAVESPCHEARPSLASDSWHGTDAGADPADPGRRGRWLRRRRDPRQPAAVPRHVRHDGAGVSPHVWLDVVSGGDQSAHAPRLGARQRDPDRGGDRPWTHQGGRRHGVHDAHTIGRKPATLAEMRVCIATLRALLAGETVAFGQTSGSLAYASRRRIPVLMAASGPKATELAGEIADGVLLSVGCHPRIVEAVLSHLAAGARRGGRRLEDLEVLWAVRVGIAGSTAEARRQARPTVVHQALLSARSHWLPYTGLTLPRFDIPPAVRAIYPDLSHSP